MDYPTIGIGVFALLYGIFTLTVRMKNPEKLGKLVAMKEKFGDKNGTLLHVIGYTIMPVVVGMVFIISGLNGVSLL